MPLINHIEVKSLALILLGNFNPSIIQPYWLAYKELIRESEAKETKLELIHNELVSFDLGWAKIDVRPERFEIATKSSPYFGMVKDLTTGIFTYLKETPIKAIGLNFIYTLNLKTQEGYYQFGNKFCPLSNWGFLNDPRVINIELFEKNRADKLPGHLRIRIESTNANDFGVNIVITDHLDVDTLKPGKENELVQILNKQWQSAANNAEKCLNEIWNKYES